MTMVGERVTLHGTPKEQTELTAAVAENCTCEFDPETGMLTKRCSVHEALVNSQSFVDHFEFAHTLRAQLIRGEFGLEPTTHKGEPC